MANILDEPIYLAPLATAISVGVTIILWLANRRDKQLSFDIVSDFTLVTASEELVEHIQILAQGAEMHDVRLVTVRVRNSGHVPIQPADYAENLALAFGDGKILSATVVEAQPEYLTDKRMNGSGTDRPGGSSCIAGYNDSEVVFKPLLLNPKDFFVVKVFIIGGTQKPLLKGHVAGIASFRRSRDIVLPGRLLLHAGLFLMLGAALLFDFDALASDKFLVCFPNLIIFMVGYLMLLKAFYEREDKLIDG